MPIVREKGTATADAATPRGLAPRPRTRPATSPAERRANRIARPPRGPDRRVPYRVRRGRPCGCRGAAGGNPFRRRRAARVRYARAYPVTGCAGQIYAHAFHPTTPGRPRPAHPAGAQNHGRARIRREVPAVDVLDPHLRQLRRDPQRRTRGPGHLRLSACRAGCDPLLRAGGPLDAEPAARPGLGGAVLRDCGTAETRRTASARRVAGRDPAPDHPPGRGRHLPPGVVAQPRPPRLPERP